MGHRPVWLAWSLYGVVTCLVIVTAGVDLLGQYGSTNALQFADEALISLATPLVLATVAALILSHQPRNTIGWLLMAPVGAFLVIGPLVNYVEHLAPSSPEPTAVLLLIVWLSNWAWLLLIIPLLYILLLFPSGRPLTPRWRWVGVAAIAWATLFVLMVTLSQKLTTPELMFNNPVGVLGEAAVERLAGVWIVGLLALVVACTVSLFIRYRRANDTERKQIKWLLYACAVFLVLFVGGTVSGVSGTITLGGHIWGVFFGLSIVMLPAAIGIAILRYRLYEIDTLINRTLVYGSLTAMLALVYFGGVATIQAIFGALTGGEQQPQIAVVVSTLVIAALFNPLRRRIQAFIDRRFYRSKYDARTTLEDFSARLRDETDLEALNGELVEVVRETMQPSHVSLWLRPDTAAKGEQPD